MKHRFFMGGLIPLCIALAIITATPLKAAWAAEYTQPTGLGLARVTYITGDTLFNSKDTEGWSALSPNFTLRDGDRLWAGDKSKIEVRFADGAGAWLNYQTGLDVVKLGHGKEGDVYQIALVSGEASFDVKNFKTLNSVFQVDTPNASIRTYGKAGFRAATLSDGTTQVGVRKGSVEVETRQGVTEVRKGEMLEVLPDGRTRITNLPPKDGWDKWVASRMSRYDRPARSARYLPPDMGDYAYEFDNGGRWVSYPDYGYVWVPTVVVAGWSPYSNGRWVWIDGDYVWLPYDPWYAPFHFGRWRWAVSIGWFWAPPLPGVAFWSPGYVGWCWGPDFVYWVPLAPGEIYYGWGYYGPLSVNIQQTTIVNVTNVFVNSRVTNGVVVVNRDNFLRGEVRRVKISDPQNPFVHRGIKDTKLIGASPVREMKPIKETRLPKPAARVTERMLPPRQVEKRAGFEKERAVAKERERSAFKPGEAAPRLREVERGKKPAERAVRERAFERRGAETRPSERVRPQPSGKAERREMAPRERAAPSPTERERAGRPGKRPPAETVRPERPGGRRESAPETRGRRPERTVEAPGVERPARPERQPKLRREAAPSGVEKGAPGPAGTREEKPAPKGREKKHVED